MSYTPVFPLKAQNGTEIWPGLNPNKKGPSCKMLKPLILLGGPTRA